MSATSDTEIANLALSRVGEKEEITDLSMANSLAAKQCRLHYARTRNALLRSHPWNFAVKRVALAATTSTPAFEYTYEFTLPTDCLKVIRTSWEATGWTTRDTLWAGWDDYTPYRIEGRKLLANESTCSIEYIAEITDVSQFDELFIEALSFKLALAVAPALTNNRSLIETLNQQAEMAMLEARTVDAQEGSARDVIDDTTFVRARF